MAPGSHRKPSLYTVQGCSLEGTRRRLTQGCAQARRKPLPHGRLSGSPPVTWGGVSLEAQPRQPEARQRSPESPEPRRRELVARSLPTEASPAGEPASADG